MNRPLKREILVYQNFFSSDSFSSNHGSKNKYVSVSNPEKTLVFRQMNRNYNNSEFNPIAKVPHPSEFHDETNRPLRKTDKGGGKQVFNEMIHKRERCGHKRKRKIDIYDGKSSLTDANQPRSKLIIRKEGRKHAKPIDYPYDVRDTNIKVYRTELNESLFCKPVEKTVDKMYCMCKGRPPSIHCPFNGGGGGGGGREKKRMNCYDKNTLDKSTNPDEKTVNEIVQTEKPSAEDKEVCAFLSDLESCMYMEQCEGSTITKWKCKRLKRACDQNPCSCSDQTAGKERGSLFQPSCDSTGQGPDSMKDKKRSVSARGQRVEEVCRSTRKTSMNDIGTRTSRRKASRLPMDGNDVRTTSRISPRKMMDDQDSRSGVRPYSRKQMDSNETRTSIRIAPLRKPVEENRAICRVAGLSMNVVENKSACKAAPRAPVNEFDSRSSNRKPSRQRVGCGDNKPIFKSSSRCSVLEYGNKSGNKKSSRKSLENGVICRSPSGSSMDDMYDD